jgi:hypothetical protein
MVMDDSIGMRIIDHHDSLEAAESQAAYLVERGVGATVEPDGATGSHGVAVLSGDVSRAREVLGLDQVESQDLTETELISANRPWLVPVLMIALALFIIPVVAFFFAFKISGG